MTAMIGLNARSTMDLDATVKGIKVNAEDVEQIIASIASVPLDDGISFRIKSIGEIMDEAEYPGIRVNMETRFDGVITPFKVDISTGDIITPKEVRYQLKLMLEEREIDGGLQPGDDSGRKVGNHYFPQYNQYPHERFL